MAEGGGSGGQGEFRDVVHGAEHDGRHDTLTNIGRDQSDLRVTRRLERQDEAEAGRDRLPVVTDDREGGATGIVGG